MLNEDKIVKLIKECTYEATEEEMREIEAEEYNDVYFDETVEGLAMYFDSLEQGSEEEYFEMRFNHYSEDAIYKTDKGYYILSVM